MLNVLMMIQGALCLSLIFLVLLQQGKGADAGAIMGGGADSVLGAGAAGTFVTRLTTSLAIAFMVTSILLVKAYSAGPGVPVKKIDPLKGSVMEGEAVPVEVPAAEEGAPVEKDAAAPAEDEAPVEAAAEAETAAAPAAAPAVEVTTETTEEKVDEVAAAEEKKEAPAAE